MKIAANPSLAFPYVQMVADLERKTICTKSIKSSIWKNQFLTGQNYTTLRESDLWNFIVLEIKFNRFLYAMF